MTTNALRETIGRGINAHQAGQVKEALACDVPVVSVSVGDVAERIAGIDGCHLADATPDTLADALARVSRSTRRVR